MKPQAEALLQAALRVRENAYAPYSHFCVGAALLGADGVEKIVELKLDGVEKDRFAESVAAARNTQNNLGDALKK